MWRRRECKVILKTLALSFITVKSNWAVGKKTLSYGTRSQSVLKRLLIRTLKRSVSSLVHHIWHLILRLIILRHLNRSLNLVLLRHCIFCSHSKITLSIIFHKLRLVIKVHCLAHWRICWCFISKYRFLKIVNRVLINLIKCGSICIEFKWIDIFLLFELVCHY